MDKPPQPPGSPIAAAVAGATLMAEAIAAYKAVDAECTAALPAIAAAPVGPERTAARARFMDATRRRTAARERLVDLGHKGAALGIIE